MTSPNMIFKDKLNSDGFNHIRYPDFSVFHETLKKEHSKIHFCSPIKNKDPAVKSEKAHEAQGLQSTEQSKSTAFQSGVDETVRDSTSRRTLVSRQEGSNKVSSFLVQDGPNIKPKCNWDLHGSYEHQRKRSVLIDQATKRVKLVSSSPHEQSKQDQNASSSQKTRQWRTLGFEEQRQINLLKRATCHESRTQITHATMKSFGMLVTKRTKDMNVSLLLKKRIPLLQNGHPYAPAIWRHKKVQAFNPSQALALPSRAYIFHSVKIPQTQQQDFQFSKRHDKLILKADLLQVQERKRALTKMLKNAFFSVRSFAANKNPIAMCLRLAKYSRNQELRDEEAKLEEAKMQNGSLLQNILSEEQQAKKEVNSDIHEPLFEFQVLEDINKFNDLLHFFFEKRTMIDVKKEQTWIDYYEPRNSSLTPKLEEIQKICQESTAKLTQLRKKLKLIGSHQVLMRLVQICSQLSKTLYSHYMGNRLIDVENISKFNILTNGKIYLVHLRPRKMEEKDVFKVIEGYMEKLSTHCQKIAKLEIFCTEMKRFKSKSLFSRCSFFLKEIKDDDDLFEACISIMKRNYIIETTIKVPAVKQHLAFLAFKKIMKLKDLSKFTLVTDDSDIQINVEKEDIKDFVLKLDSLKRKGDDSMWCSIPKALGKRKAKAQKKDVVKLEWLAPGNERLDQSSTCKDAHKEQQIGDKPLEQGEDQDHLVITLPSKIAPRQSGIDFLTFEDQDN